MQKARFILFFSTLCSIALLSSCGTDPEGYHINPIMLKKLAQSFPSFFSLEKFTKILKEEGLKAASHNVNSALKISCNNAALHFLNGFLYEEMERAGEKGSDQLAAVAYKAAFGLDPSNPVGCYLYGSHKLRLGEYAVAQQFLSYACVLNPKSPDAFYGLAYCSYYLCDLPVALSAIKTALKINPKSPEIQRAAAMIFAATGNTALAEKALKCYGSSVGFTHTAYTRTHERVQQWHAVSKEAHNKSKICTPIPKEAVEPDPEDGEPETLFIDCYIMMMHEDKNVLQGVNIFDQLNIILGNSSPLALVKRQLERNPDKYGGSNDVFGDWHKEFLFTVTAQSAKYSLNIANTQKRTLSILSRPTLTTIVKKTATFEDGSVYIASTEGAAGGGMINIPTGTNLSVTPLRITESDEVIMTIDVSASAFSSSPIFSQSISDQLVERSIGTVTATSKALIGQTVIIAGSHEIIDTSNRSDTPGLASIPLVQYFFSQKSTVQSRRNTLYLITVRRSDAKRKKKRSLINPSEAQRFLKNTGFWSVGEYSSLFYILQFLESSPMFADFQSGDLAEPTNTFYIMSLEEKLSYLSRFLYF